MVCAGLQQFAEFAPFFSVPASSRKFRPLATNQKVVKHKSQYISVLLE